MSMCTEGELFLDGSNWCTAHEDFTPQQVINVAVLTSASPHPPSIISARGTVSDKGWCIRWPMASFCSSNFLKQAHTFLFPTTWTRNTTTESSTDLAALQTVNCLSCGLLPDTIQPNRPQTWLLYRQ
ncbi:hypothetical protein BaRGS_00029909 [Batillaria attramentaria]|uniref:Uncharacterized protein n=1 Tax=Batillaria attramentaria TaxID=370345 RepID=A0ABD0JW44_9CAEN